MCVPFNVPQVIDRILFKLDELVRPYVHKILVVIEPLLIDEVRGECFLCGCACACVRVRACAYVGRVGGWVGG